MTECSEMSRLYYTEVDHTEFSVIYIKVIKLVNSLLVVLSCSVFHPLRKWHEAQ